MNIETRILSSLEKVFPTEAPKPLTQPLTFLKGEIASFQVAVAPDHQPHHFGRLSMKVEVASDLPVTVNQVGYIPVTLPYFNNEDSRYLKNEPGMFPDPLMPSVDGIFTIPTGRWTSFFFQVDTENATPGEHKIAVSFIPSGDGEGAYPPFSAETSITVMKTAIPHQKLVYTAWFHTDCLADFYKVPVFSEEHWSIVKEQAKAARKYGQNMILVPMFTPPLDTQIGGERTTVQTVGVTVNGSMKDPASYSFDFTLFDRFIATAREAGMEYFELSHLFTQWGGKACPKVMATIDGEYKRIFGWDVESTSDEYKAFLTAYLPTLVKHIDALNMRGCTYFHLTDEPHGDHLPQYLRLKNIVHPLIDGYPIMDALSDYDYYYSGVSEIPVVATTALKPFLEGKRPEEFWVYYCCGQGTDNLSNRFMNMPGYRTRVLGLQMYEENVDGFLQWGLNFYNSRQSLRHINPFQVTDGDGAWPAGDPFVLYPGEDGKPIISQRLIHFNEGLQDQRALQLLESLTDQDHVKALIREVTGSDITFNSYPTGEDFELKLRNKVNAEIDALS